MSPKVQRILRMPAVTDRCGRHRNSVYNDIRAGLFPAPVSIGARARGWPEHEVDAILRARIAGKPEADIRALVTQLQAARLQPASA